MFFYYLLRHYNVRIWLFFGWSVYVFYYLPRHYNVENLIVLWVKCACFFYYLPRHYNVENLIVFWVKCACFFYYLPRHYNVRIWLFFGWSVHVFSNYSPNTLSQWWVDDVPASMTLAQHQPNIGTTSRVSWVWSDDIIHQILNDDNQVIDKRYSVYFCNGLNILIVNKI